MMIKSIKNPYFKAISLVVLACLTFTSCKKSTSGTGKLTYSFKAVNSGAVKLASTGSLKTFSVTTAPTSPTNIIWNSGYVYISDVEFKAVKDTTHIKYESKALKKIDLFSTSVSLFNDVVLTSGVYDEIKLEVSIGSPSGLNEPGIYLKGTYKDIPLTFAYDENGDQFGFEIEGYKFSFDKTKDYSGLISLHLNLLLNGLTNADLDAATKVNGVIVINHTNNIKIYQQIKQNVQSISDVEFGDKNN
jgi:hypothetical protein